ncbi:DUF2946 family protein [Dyella flava]|uniref:DUF2946 family protein n=2 Tax=Dyella flava TaxID=1920170 RepID=A0ABS2JZK7_9GAMM|nr:DUF2946 family protein [Dyella flava]
MLLIVVMPAVSRSLSSSANMGADCRMGLSHTDHGHRHGTPGDPYDPTVACGYCSLLAHTPIATFDVGAALAPTYLPAFVPDAGLLHDSPDAQVLSAHPRGPPHIG